jgi:hypothetical protein
VHEPSQKRQSSLKYTRVSINITLRTFCMSRQKDLMCPTIYQVTTRGCFVE